MVEAETLVGLTKMSERLMERVEKLCESGCTFGQVQAQESKDMTRRVGDLETKFWWIIVLAFTTLIGIAFDIGLNLMKVGQSMGRMPIP